MRRRRDRQNELLVAIIVTIAMAFALVFGILLSLGNSDGEDTNRQDTPAAAETRPTRPVAVAPSATPHDDTLETEEPTLTPTLTETEAASSTPTEKGIASPTPTDETSASPTPSVTASSTPTEKASPTPTEEASALPTLSETATPTRKPTRRPSETRTPTEKPTATASSTLTRTPTMTHTPTASPTPTATATLTASATPTATHTPTATAILTATRTPTVTQTASSTPTRTPSPTRTATPTLVAQAASPTPSPAATSTTVPLAASPLPSPTPCTLREDWDVYIVEIGDTFFSLARRFGVPLNELAAANCIANPSVIYAGQPLFVPSGGQNPTDAAFEKCNTPNAIFTAPKAGQSLDGVVTLRGLAFGDGFRRYILDWRPDDPTVDFRSFAEIFTPVTVEGDLGTFNSDAFAPGLYWFRLRVLETNDYIIGECTIRVRFR